jgi:hypothetical protein
MRVRMLDANGDMTFGFGQANFYHNSPAGVAQCIKTRLLLLAGEWFLDSTDGTPWSTEVLGKYTSGLYDPMIQARILGTTGVVGIVDGTYTSSFNSQLRTLAISCIVTTLYGTTENIQVSL